MTPGDLHHELARAAALAAATGGPCWHCGAPAPGRGDGAPPVCVDAGACFARSVSPPPGGPLSPESAAMLRAGIESGRTEPSVYLGSFAENNEEERG